MKSSKALALIFSILLITASSTSTPLLKAETLSTNQQTSTGSNQQAVASYVIGVSANRVPLKLIPIPSVSVNHGVKIGPNDADIIVLAIPATQKSENVDLIGFITGFLTKAAARQEGLSGQLIADLYSSLYEQLIRMGAKQAFLPYENLTFTFIIIVWIKTVSLSEFITNVGANMLKSVSDSLILVTFSLTKNVLNEIKISISSKIKDNAETLKQQINSKLAEINNQLINYLDSKIDSLKCKEICKQINETKRECSYAVDSITINPTVTTTLRNGIISTSIKIDERSYDYTTGNLATESKETFIQQAKNVVESQSYDKDLVDSTEVTSIINTIGGFIYDSIYRLESRASASEDFIVGVSGYYSSCEAAKEAMKRVAREVVVKIIDFIRNKVNENIDFVAGKIIEKLENVFNTISNTLDKISNNLQKAASEAVNSAKEFLETTVHSAISQVITKLNPTVFAVYAFAEGFSQALQTCVSSIRITTKPPQSGNLDQSILIVEEKRSSTREIVREVRLPGPDDTITAEKSTSLGEKFLSAAKGFAAGVLGAVFGPAARKIINVIPSVFVVNVQLKSDNRWLIAPSWPGVYTINLRVAPSTYAEWLSNLPNNLKNIFFKDIDIQKNELAGRLEKLININLGKVTIEGAESGAEMILPYLVLPPYFIVERVMVENGIVSLKLVAIYDFSAIMRIFIKDQINKFKEAVNKATEIVDKLRETIKSAIKGLVEKFVDIVISYCYSKLTIDFVRSLIENLYRYILDYIFNKIINPILDQLFEKYVKAHIIKLTELLNEILNRVEQQLDLFSRYLALSLSVIRVDVVNSDIELTPALPTLGFIGNRPIDQFGKVEVRLSQNIFYRFLGDCIGVIPLYRSVGRDGRVSYFIAPWAAQSLEPVVTPLIPVARIENNKLNVVFLSPFVNQLTNVRYTFVVDGTEMREVSVDALQRAAVIGVRVLSVRIDNTRGVGAILPLPIESPIVVNPSILARKV